MSEEKDDSNVEIKIEEFSTKYQDEAQQIIEEGLKERWGKKYDPSFNADLSDISTNFAFTIIATLNSTPIGTGSYSIENKDTIRIERMSIRREYRKRGVGSKILECLLSNARERGYKIAVVETTSTWESAVLFYQNHSFVFREIIDGDSHFSLSL